MSASSELALKRNFYQKSPDTTGEEEETNPYQNNKSKEAPFLG